MSASGGVSAPPQSGPALNGLPATMQACALDCTICGWRDIEFAAEIEFNQTYSIADFLGLPCSDRENGNHRLGLT